MAAPLFTTGATYLGGAGAAAGGGAGLAALAPWLAIPAAIGGGIAYGTSPTVRHWVNDQAKNALGGIEHNVQSMMSPSFLSGILGQNGGGNGMPDAGLDSGSGGLNSLLQNALGQMGQKSQDKKQQGGAGGFSPTDIYPSTSAIMPLQNPTYAPPNPINPIPPLYGMGGKYQGQM